MHENSLGIAALSTCLRGLSVLPARVQLVNLTPVIFGSGLGVGTYHYLARRWHVMLLAIYTV